MTQRLLSAPRAVVRVLPQRLQPSPDGLVALDDTGNVMVERAGILDGFGMPSGVSRGRGTLWLGSLTADCVAALRAERRPPAQSAGAVP